MEPSSANAAQPAKEMAAPNSHTSRNQKGCGSTPAMSFAVRKMDDPMMPLTSRSTESSRLRSRNREGLDSDEALGSALVTMGEFIDYPMPSSSGDSRGVPQRGQMIEPQSPHVRGFGTSWAQFGQ